jgi:hypothetical protein
MARLEAPMAISRTRVRIIDHGHFSERRIEAVKVHYPWLKFLMLWLLGDGRFIAEAKAQIDAINKIRQYEADHPRRPNVRPGPQGPANISFR